MKSFKNVALYTTSEFLGNIIRKDCKEVLIEETSYAQYSKALKVMYLEKGKRKHRGFYVYGSKLLMLMDLAEAVVPDSMYGEPKDVGHGLVSREGRYSSFDEGWVNDFMKKVEGKKLVFNFAEVVHA